MDLMDIFPVIYIIIFIVGVFGNCIFIGVVSITKDLHFPVFLILSNECVSDVLFLYGTIFLATDYIMVGK